MKCKLLHQVDSFQFKSLLKEYFLKRKVEQLENNGTDERATLSEEFFHNQRALAFSFCSYLPAQFRKLQKAPFLLLAIRPIICSKALYLYT
jgi:hypothetical protein